MQDKEIIDLPNIAVSGWSGAGSTSVTLILSYLLSKKYIPVSQIFRIINKKLSKKGDEQLKKEYEEFIQPLIGSAIDNYVDYKLLNHSNIIIESDITAFRIGKHPKVFSIFLKANQKTRLKRIAGDDRNKEANVAERDEALRQAYINLWNIDIFDDELIDRKYNLVIDNSKVDLLQELYIIIDMLQNHPAYEKSLDWSKIIKKVPKEVNSFLKKGKEEYINKLKKAKLLMKPEKIMLEIVQLFPEEVNAYNIEVQDIFLGRR
jgi:cytidylate kinase